MKSKLFRALGLAGVIAAVLFAASDSWATLAGKISSSIAITYSTAQDIGTATWSTGTTGSASITLTDGSTANKANKIFQDHGTTGTTYDLDSGSLANPLGATQAAFSRIVSIRVCAPSTNTANVALTGDWLLTKYLVAGGDTLANVSIPVHPGGCWMFTAPSATGVAVTATTGDGFTVTPSGTEAFDVLIIGS